MTARALVIVAHNRCLAAGLASLVVGALTFLFVALLAVTSAVSGAWLVVPSVVMVTGVAVVGAWLIFGGGAQRFDPAPVATRQPWPWGTSKR